MNAIGFSVIISDSQTIDEQLSLLRSMLDAGCEAIELHLTASIDMPERDKERLFAAIKHFSYRSIHASHITIQQQAADLLHYQGLIYRVDAHAITIHPDGMKQWRWLVDELGDRVSFENMDCEKDFGKTPKDMQRVFADAPSSRWTFDLNHVYTNDQMMRSVDEFYAYADRLAHYHVSGYGGVELPHTTLHDRNQDIILASVKTQHPVIIESYGVADIGYFHDELAYVRRFLLNRQ